MFNLRGNICGLAANLVKAVWAVGTTQGATGSLNSTNAITYVIDGIQYTLGAQTSKAIALATTPLVPFVQPVLTTCLYLIQVDSAQAVTIVPGTPVLATDLSNGAKVLAWPQPADNVAVVGAYRVTLASTATYQPGVTALNATNVTTTYYDLACLPSNPLTS